MADDPRKPKKDSGVQQNIDSVSGGNVIGQQHNYYGERKPDDLSLLLPYLHWLHERAMSSDLLRALNPRSSSQFSDAQTLKISDIYTPLDTRSMIMRNQQGQIIKPGGSYSQPFGLEKTDAETFPLKVMEAVDWFPRFVLLGDPGSGKSTVMNFLALCLSGHWIGALTGNGDSVGTRYIVSLRNDANYDWLGELTAQGWTQGAKIPVLVTLRDFAQDKAVVEAEKGTARLLWDYIAREVSSRNASPEALERALREGQVLVMLDGLDEVPSESRVLVRDTVTDFMSAHSNNHFLMTCRILSYTNPEWQIADVNVETLAPFDPEKVRHFVNAWYTASARINPALYAGNAEERIRDLTERLDDPGLLRIAENPMLLTVMVWVHNSTGTLPHERAKLYFKCVELLMFNWKPDAAKSLKEELGIREGDDSAVYGVLWQVAFRAHASQSQREDAADIPGYEIVDIVNSQLGGTLDMGKVFCEYVEKRAGLLIGRGDSGIKRIFSFPHRTFQEYLAGCYLAGENFRDGDFADDAVDCFEAAVFQLARENFAGWRVALLLAVEHLYHNAQNTTLPLRAVEELCPADWMPQSDHNWRLVWLAGEMLEKVGLQAVLTHRKGEKILKRLQTMLAELVGGGQLEPSERAAAGRTLSLLGDPRPGVGVVRVEAVGAHGRAPLPKTIEIPDIDWVEIPAGEFIYQKDQRIYLPAYYIARYPVTYRQFQAFVEAEDGYNDDRWWEGIAERYRELYDATWPYNNHPRESVTWFHSVAFCRWLTAKYQTYGREVGAQGLAPLQDMFSSGQFEIRLPTEQEWEKAARGTDGRIYPWGKDYVSSYANVDETRDNVGSHFLGQTSAVGMYPQGRSPYEMLDMSGNVDEWCLDEYDGGEFGNIASNNRRSLRGGSWLFNQQYARAASRSYLNPYDWDDSQGFRVVAAPINDL